MNANVNDYVGISIAVAVADVIVIIDVFILINQTCISVIYGDNL